MPALATCAAASSTNSVSRSTNSLGKSPGQSFLSSVISLRPFAGGSGGSSAPTGGGFGVGSTGSGPGGPRIMPKKLWRSRSKSQGRSSVTSQSNWVPLEVGCSFFYLLRVERSEWYLKIRAKRVSYKLFNNDKRLIQSLFWFLLG